ncbi:XdhC/CoxI family protein [Streptomyces sp. NPDC002588]|uniref:XdhC family protein n=1 Tax=Streptomyces sp. NPDC002588 TaxID=3154419 RepID=UPI003321FA2B
MLELGKEPLRRLDEDEGAPLAVAIVTAVPRARPAPRSPSTGTAPPSAASRGGCVEGSVYPCVPNCRPRGSRGRRRYTASATTTKTRSRSVIVVEGHGRLLGQTLTVRGDGSHVGGLGDVGLDHEALAQARAALEAGGARTVEVGPLASGAASLTLLVEGALLAPRMLIFGAIDHVAALAQAGAFPGCRVTVCDARRTFATAQPFPYADEVVVDWPHRCLDAQRFDRRAGVCVPTRDPTFGIPLLTRALRLSVAYVGTMGSWRTHLQRTDLLREAGLTEVELSRLRSPIGLALGGRTPQETALAITAEIMAVAHRGGGRFALDRGTHQPRRRPRPHGGDKPQSSGRTVRFGSGAGGVYIQTEPFG